MPDRIPLNRIGTTKEGTVYLKAEKNIGAGERFYTDQENYKMLVESIGEVPEGTFDWFKIVTVEEKPNVKED